MAIEAPLRRKQKGEILLGGACLNCAAPLETHFCPHCGQKNAPADLSVWSVLHEFFVELFYYDSKIWRTLRNLLFHPGLLSNEWVQGRRTRYLSPVRLYLSVAFLFFVGMAWHSGKLNVQTRMDAKSQAELINALKSADMTPFERRQTLEALQNTNLTPQNRRLLDSVLSGAPTAGTAKAGSVPTPKSATGDVGVLRHRAGWFGVQINKVEWAAERDPTSIQTAYRDQIPRVLFVVLPVFAAALTLLYWRPRRYYVEHLVFVLHLHSFAFLILLPASYLSPGVAIPIALAWMAVYGFVAMLRFYRQAWWLTALKAWVMSIVYSVLLVFGALLALVLTTVIALPDPPPTAYKAAEPATATPNPHQSAPPAATLPAGKVGAG